jgi:hypothetical protein
MAEIIMLTAQCHLGSLTSEDCFVSPGTCMSVCHYENKCMHTLCVCVCVCVCVHALSLTTVGPGLFPTAGHRFSLTINITTY